MREGSQHRFFEGVVCLLLPRIHFQRELGSSLRGHVGVLFTSPQDVWFEDTLEGVLMTWLDAQDLIPILGALRQHPGLDERPIGAEEGTIQDVEVGPKIFCSPRHRGSR